MAEALLFCFVFLSQILLISVFFPGRAVSRMRHLLRTCPPSTHPKLYPQPAAYYERVLRNFTRLTQAIVVAGVLIIAALLVATLSGDWDGAIVTPWSASGEWDAAIVIPFFLVQFVPIGYLEFVGLKHYNAMAKAAPPRVRTADLRRRRLVDFVSPAMLVGAVLAYVAFVGFVLYYRRFDFAWFTAAGNIAVITAMNLAMAAGVGFALRRLRHDHHLAYESRLHVMRLIVKQALMISIASPVLIAMNLVVKLFAPDTLEPVIASVHVQAFALAALWPAYSHRVAKIDFDVYRQDTDVAAGPRDARAGLSAADAAEPG